MIASGELPRMAPGRLLAALYRVSQRGGSLLLAFLRRSMFAFAMLAPAQCIFVAAHFIRRLRLQLRNLLHTAVLINSNKHKVSARNVRHRAGPRVFRP